MAIPSDDSTVTTTTNIVIVIADACIWSLISISLAYCTL
jgi:hypothetical protein